MASEHPTGYWKQGNQHNLRADAFGVQVWIRFHRGERETRLYGDIYKREVNNDAKGR